MPSQETIQPIPTDTARVAKTVYSGSNLYLSIGDRLAALLEGIHLNTSAGVAAPPRPGKPPLALVTFFQHLEKLSDHQAVEAASMRIDWKYALHLSMNYPGMDPMALCQFRQTLLNQPSRLGEFQRFLDRLSEAGYVKEIQAQPLDARRVLAEVCVRTRLERVMASMLHTLQALATRHPEWLRRTSLPHWYRRYDVMNPQPDLTQSLEQQQALAEAMGTDIAYLLQAISQAGRPELVSLSEVLELHRVWREQFDPNYLEDAKFLSYCYFCGSAQP